MEYNLTIEELEQLDMLMGIREAHKERMALEEPVWRSKPLLRRQAEALPLEHEAASESFLVAELEGRCKLSKETRLKEEKRLAKRGKKRKPYTYRDGSRKHRKTKEATKRRYREKLWKKDPLTRIRHSFRQGVDITAEEWQRLIEPVWQSFSAESLRLRATESNRLNVYNLLIIHTPKGRGASPQVVYDGPSQAVWDSQDPAYSARVMELGKK
jgi:hypothetical protein